MGGLAAEIGGLEEKLDKVQTTLDDHEEKLEKVQTTLDEQGKTLGQHRSELKKIHEKCGFLFEVAASDETRRLYGDPFSRHFIAQDFRGLARLALSKDDFADPLEFDEFFS